MIEKFEDLGINDIQFAEDIEGPVIPVSYEELHQEYLAKIGDRVQQKLGVSFTQMQDALSVATVNKAEEIVLEMPNIAPLGDYSKLLEDNDGMANFLKTEGHKPEHWKISEIRMVDEKVMKNMITFAFANDAVDDGQVMKGFVYINFEGKIKHAFCQGNDD